MAGVGARRAGITGANASMLGAIKKAMIGSRYKGQRGGGVFFWQPRRANVYLSVAALASFWRLFLVACEGLPCPL